MDNNEIKPKKSRKALWLTLASAVVVIAGLLLALSIINSRPVTDIAEKVVKTYMSGNYEKTESYMLFDTDVDSTIIDLLKETYGSGLRYKIISEREVKRGHQSYLCDDYEYSIEYFQDVNDEAFDNEKLNVYDVEDISIITFKLKIEGDERKGYETLSLTMIKYDGKWKVYNVVY